MRVGLVCPYAWDVPGGVRTHVADLALTLAELGHDVSVLAPAEDPRSLPTWVVDGGRPVALPYNGSVAKVTLGFGTTRRIRSWIREGEVGVLHGAAPVARGLSLIARWARSGARVGSWHCS
ncbi:MAG: glycosyltransferase family 4 protein, partial [Actinomycetales bacterium]